MSMEPRTGPDGIPEVEATFTVDELAALAELAGAPSFPGTGEHTLDDPARREARRALVRRGTVVGDGNGGIAIEPAQRAMLGCALGANAVLSVRRDGDVSLLHVRPSLTLEQRAAGAGRQRLVAFPTPMLPRRVATITGLAGATPGVGDPIVLSSAEAARLVTGDVTPLRGALAEEVRGTSAVHVLRRRGNRVTGGEIAWVDAGGRGLWLVTATPPALAPAPAAGSDVMARLRALLG